MVWVKDTVGKMAMSMGNTMIFHWILGVPALIRWWIGDTGTEHVAPPKIPWFSIIKWPLLGFTQVSDPIKYHTIWRWLMLNVHPDPMTYALTIPSIFPRFLLRWNHVKSLLGSWTIRCACAEFQGNGGPSSMQLLQGGSMAPQGYPGGCPRNDGTINGTPTPLFQVQSHQKEC